LSRSFIYMVNPDGSIRRMEPSPPETEDRMQELVARYPELICDGDDDLLLIRREHPIADTEEGNGRWSLDHLFVTRDAVPVLVELKRSVDSRLRREVVGQLLDYAANATAYWQVDGLAESFAKTAAEAGLDPEAALSSFIGDQDPTVFWNQVDANLKAGRIKLVFVADEIPRELARIVEFLNDQMRAEVRAVELRWFTGKDGTISLSPRIIGATERAAAAKNTPQRLEPISCEQWLQRHIAPAGEQALSGARTFIELVEKVGGKVGIPARQGSIYACFQGADGKPYYPLHLRSSGPFVSFTLRFLYYRPMLKDEGVRQRLLNELTKVVGPLTTSNLKGYPSFKVELLADPAIAKRFEEWLTSALEQMG